MIRSRRTFDCNVGQLGASHFEHLSTCLYVGFDYVRMCAVAVFPSTLHPVGNDAPPLTDMCVLSVQVTVLFCTVSRYAGQLLMYLSVAVMNRTYDAAWPCHVKSGNRCALRQTKANNDACLSHVI